MLPTIPENLNVKSFWEKPEGTTGMLFLAAGGLGLFLAMPAILGFMGMLLTLLGQTIAITVMGSFLAAFLYIVTNKKFLTLCKYMFKSSMRWITGMFIEIDPIGIMKGYIDSLKEKREVLKEKKSQLSGEIRKCKESIASSTKDYANAMNSAASAKKDNRTNLITLHTRNAGRLETFVAKLNTTLKKMEVLYGALNKYDEVTGIVIEDLASEIKIREQERKMILASSGAMKAAMSILSGGGDERELFDQAMEYVVEDYGKKLGEIEDFMSDTKIIIDGIDLQNAVWEETALKRLEAWENKTNSILLGDKKQELLENNYTPIPIELSKTGDNEYAKIFK